MIYLFLALSVFLVFLTACSAQVDDVPPLDIDQLEGSDVVLEDEILPELLEESEFIEIGEMI